MSDWWKIAALLLVLFLGWMVLPAVQGYHLGCNPLIDHERVVRLGIEWCK